MRETSPSSERFHLLRSMGGRRSRNKLISSVLAKISPPPSISASEQSYCVHLINSVWLHMTTYMLSYYLMALRYK